MNPDEQLRRYQELLLSWNEKVNLIGPEARRNLKDHIGEALAAALFLGLAGEVLDVGSGGGLPAIPMAIRCPEARFHLVEADKKKWSFLKFVARECALNCRIYGDRLERVVITFPSELRFDFVTSRAVGHPDRWLGSVAGRLAPDGRVALFEGSSLVPTVRGFELDRTHRLPRGESNFLVVLKRSTWNTGSTKAHG